MIEALVKFLMFVLMMTPVFVLGGCIVFCMVDDLIFSGELKAWAKRKLR